jgi:hypothetical protein
VKVPSYWLRENDGRVYVPQFECGGAQTDGTCVVQLTAGIM